MNKDKTMSNQSIFLTEDLKDFNFKELFLKLTEFTIPFGFEDELEPILYGIVPNLEKDLYGNYHITIGKSRTLFTSHLDTYSKRKEKINHVVKGGKIYTDGTTVLGGDNKNGVIILLYMILQEVPGNYYFFRGEEGIVTGSSCNGSNFLLMTNPTIHTSIDRAIAFDRRGKGSVVTKQRARHCCSDEFADTLVNNFIECGLPFKKDYAYGTDSAVFMDIVPEITNISSGGEYEHSFKEMTNINYTRKVAEAAIKIKWEKLPIKRIPSAIETSYDKLYNNSIYKANKKIYNKITAMLSLKGFNCINRAGFEPNAIMQYRQFTGDKMIDLRFINKKAFIVIDNYFDINVKSFTPFGLKRYFNLNVDEVSKRIISRIANTMNKNYKLKRKRLNDFLEVYLITYDEFKNYIETSNIYKNLFEFGKKYITMDIIANQATTISRQKEQENKK